MGFILRAAAVSDLGLVRRNNEDAAYAGRHLLVVADGVGGSPAGEVASDIVVQTLLPLDDEPESAHPLSVLRQAVDQANQRVWQAATTDRAQEGMATTVTAVLLSGDKLALVHVGDSRGYLCRAAELCRLTRDDTFVQALVDRGVLSPEQARAHPQRSLVTQALHGGRVEPTERVLTPEAGDRILLCSDGLSDVVDDAEIGRVLDSDREPAACAQRLVELAHAGGAPDNVTAVVADVVIG